MTWVVFPTGSLSLGGLPPLASITLPGRYIADVPNDGGLNPRLVQVCEPTSKMRDWRSAPAVIKIRPLGITYDCGYSPTSNCAPLSAVQVLAAGSYTSGAVAGAPILRFPPPPNNPAAGGGRGGG